MASHGKFKIRKIDSINKSAYLLIDLEMHFVHLLVDGKQDGYFAGVMGLIFDTKRYDPSITDAEIEIIDMFFDNLKWDSLDVDSKGGAAVTEV